MLMQKLSPLRAPGMIMNRATPYNENGSTLIGALISIFIMSIGMTALFSLYINNTINSATSRHTSTALSYARDKIESLRFDLNNATPQPISNNEQLQKKTITYYRNWQISTDQQLQLNKIHVSIHWQDSSGNHNVNLNTLIALNP